MSKFNFGFLSSRRIICGIGLVFAVLSGAASLRAQWAPLVTDADAAQRLAWWREARFGMFLQLGRLLDSCARRMGAVVRADPH
jgi:hypothetical protein